MLLGVLLPLIEIVPNYHHKKSESFLLRNSTALPCNSSTLYGTKIEYFESFEILFHYFEHFFQNIAVPMRNQSSTGCARRKGGHIGFRTYYDS
jgi:hypothetical protein